MEALHRQRWLIGASSYPSKEIKNAVVGALRRKKFDGNWIVHERAKKYFTHRRSPAK